jgi:hypothetical protein
MIPAEYTDFMKSIPTRVSSTSNIFTVPFGTALYSVIKDTDSDNVYTGTSPVKLFSGINDYSGFLSFYFSEANSIIEKMIVNKDYAGLSEILYTYNVNYAFWNSNIPTDVLNTWVFDKRMNRSLDENFKKAFFVDKPLIVSEKGNYALYEFKRINTILKSKNLTYKKINETKFKLYIRGLKEEQVLIFSDSYHAGWKLFLDKNPNQNWCESFSSINGTRECGEKKSSIEGDELGLSFRKPVFPKTHLPRSIKLLNP